MRKTILLFLWCLSLTAWGQHVEVSDMLKYNGWRNFVDKITKSPHQTHDSIAQVILVLEKENTWLARGFREELLASQETRLDKRIQHYKDAIQYYVSAGEVLRLAEVYPTLVFILHYSSRFGEAMEYSGKTIQFAKKHDHTILFMTSLVDLGKLLIHNKQFDLARQKLLESYAIHQKNRMVITNVYYQLGEVYLALMKPDSALHYLDEGMLWTKEVGEHSEWLSLYIIKGKAHVFKKNYGEGEKIFNDAMSRIEKDANQKNKLSPLLLLIAQLYNKTNRSKEALNVIDRAFKNHGPFNNWKFFTNLRTERIKAYENLGLFQKAAEENHRWRQDMDSLLITEKKALFADAASRLDTERLKDKIEQQQGELISAQYHTYGLIALLGILLLTVFGLLQFMKRRQQQVKHEAMITQLETERLKELDRVKSAFFTNVSHEFRTPLTLITEPLKKLDRELAEGQYKNTFKRMRYAAEALLKLINEMLDIARIESGQRKLKLQPGELNSFMGKMAYSVQSLADLKHLDFRIELPEEKLHFQFDKSCLETIIINLLDNAIKYTPEFGEVKLSLHQTQNQISISIADNGIGIEQKDLPYIFDRFYRINEAEDTAQGSGIGLALIKELTELHGGKIEVSSEANHGTIFNIYLTLKPLTQEEINGLEPSETLAFKSETLTARMAIDAKKILIVEDNHELALHLRSVLQDVDKVIIATNGAEGFQQAMLEVPDIIITDLIMPVMDGFELISRLRREEVTNHIPIVLLTGNTDLDNKIEGWKRGTDAYLNKPVHTEELLSIIANLLQQRTLLQQKFAVNLFSEQKESAEWLSSEDIFMQKVMDVIAKYYEDEMFSVEKLSDEIHMSRSNLFRKVTAISGTNPTLLIRDFRLNKAMQLLKQGQPPKEVCFLTGFNSFSYFTKCFKDKFGIVPSSI